jgi:hypothetical protein
VIDESEQKVIGCVRQFWLIFRLFTLRAKVYTEVNTIQADVCASIVFFFLFIPSLIV